MPFLIAWLIALGVLLPVYYGVSHAAAFVVGLVVLVVLVAWKPRSRS